MAALLIAFASCNRQNLPQLFWKQLENLSPDLFLWTGDSVYASSNSLESQKKALEMAKGNEYYQSFYSKTEILGTWDDHDFGINDGGKSVQNKAERQSSYLNFLGLQDQQLNSQVGIYYSRDIKLENSDSSVKIIFLDTRTHRDMHYIPSIGQFHLPYTALLAAFIRLAYSTLGFGSEYAGDMLGENQWLWLEKELLESNADVNIIVSSVQVSTSNPIVESWGHFPQSKQRLYNILRNADPSGLIFFSGDVHHAEISNINYHRSDGSKGNWFEITSSGLTHTCADNFVTKLICPRMLSYFNSHRTDSNSYFIARNYGTIQISTCNTSSDKIDNGKCVNIDVSINSLDSNDVLTRKMTVSASDREAAKISVVEISRFPVIENFTLMGCISLILSLVVWIIMH